MSGVYIRYRAAKKGQIGNRKGKEGSPPLCIGLAGALMNYELLSKICGYVSRFKNVKLQ